MYAVAGGSEAEGAAATASASGAERPLPNPTAPQGRKPTPRLSRKAEVVLTSEDRSGRWFAIGETPLIDFKKAWRKGGIKVLSQRCITSLNANLKMVFIFGVYETNISGIFIVVILFK